MSILNIIIDHQSPMLTKLIKIKGQFAVRKVYEKWRKYVIQ